MDNNALEIKNVCIDYKVMSKTSIHQMFSKEHRLKKFEAFHAVKNVSFSVREGEILGIVGKNGSGKSTILKAIAGIFKPDEGVIDLKGHRVSLMSIGVGFMNELSGRENIMIAGLLLGFTPQQIRSKEQDIIEYSELGDFIDKPVRTYSSGMHSKLSFAITAMMEPEIMLVDEVLSVGDAKFKQKSLETMKNLICDKSRTVLIVSHDLGTLEKMCDRVLWMHEGEIIEIGDTKEILQKYGEFMK